MYFLLGWDNTDKIHTISESYHYRMIQNLLIINQKWIGDKPNDWKRLLIVSDIFEPPK